MGVLTLLIAALAIWLIWTGKLQRMTAKDGIALGAALVGAVLAAKGKPVERLNYTTCKKLDKQEIQIPETWRGEVGFSGTTWVGAYEFAPPSANGRHIFHKRINNLLRKDRDMLRKDKKSQ